MVSLDEVHASNAQIATTLPPKSVAVFVGATSGIGEYTLLQWARLTVEPQVYIIGRSQKAADRILAECAALNPRGAFHFIQSDISLLANVDAVCRRIRAAQPHINLLLLSQGSMLLAPRTAENLSFGGALVHHSRIRFVANLLPALSAAPALRRVVSVFAGTKEGRVDTADFEATGRAPLEARGHATAMHTLALEHLARGADDVSFVHTYPGFVRSGIARGTSGFLWGVGKAAMAVLGPFVYVPPAECGARHVYVATSAAFAPARLAVGGMVDLPKGRGTMRGSDGVKGSGVYIVDEKCEPAVAAVEETLKAQRAEGVADRVWEYTEKDFLRITGSLCV